MASMTIDVSGGAPGDAVGVTPAPSPLDFARLLADGTRQRIMSACCCRWRAVGELVEDLGGEVAQPTVSHHLGLLREAGLVRQRREGRRALYTLDQDRVAFCCGRLVLTFAPETEAAARVRPDPAEAADIELVER